MTRWTTAQFHTAKSQADALINTLVHKGEPGGMAGVVAGGQIVWQRHWGLADVAGNIPNLPGTRHCIGSASKMFTAACAWRLIQQGRLDARVPVSTYLPDISLLEQVTLHHLLTMTSGLPDHNALMTAVGGLPGHDRTLPDHLALLRKLPSLLFTPGSEFHYSDINILLVAHIIANVTGQDFDKALQDNILTPCNILDSITLRNNDTIQTRYAQPTLKTSDEWCRSGPYFPCTGGSDLALTLADCATWIDVLRSGQIDGTDIAPLWHETKISDAAPTQYGMGFMVRRYRGLRLIGHMGAMHGCKSAIFYAPDIDVGFIISRNNGNDIIHTLQSIIDIFTADTLPLPTNDLQSQQNLEKAAITDVSASKLNGSYINTDTLQTLNLSWQSPFLKVTGNGKSFDYICNTHGYFSATWGRPAHIKPVADKATGQIALDTIINGVRRRFVRVETLGPVKHGWMDYVGDYMLEALEAKLTLTGHSGTLYMRTGGLINTGWAVPLTPIAPDLFQSSQFTVQFDREPNSKLIRQLVLTNDDLPLLTFRKLRSF